MSNGYDYFGGAARVPANAAPSHADGAHDGQQGVVGAPAVDRWGMPVAAPQNAGSPAAMASGAAPASTATAWPAPPPPQAYSGYVGASPPTPAGYAPYAPQPWQPYPSGDLGARTPKGRPRGLPLTIGAIVVVVAIAVVIIMRLTAAHHIRMPDSAAGLTAAQDIPSSLQSTIHDMEHQLSSDHLHDVTTRLYGDLENNGLVVIAGHIDGADGDMEAGVEKLRQAAAAAGDQDITTGFVTSGPTSYACMWTSRNAAVSMCFWWDQHTFLLGEGVGLDAQTTADALDQVRTYAGLR